MGSTSPSSSTHEDHALPVWQPIRGFDAPALLSDRPCCHARSARRGQGVAQELPNTHGLGCSLGYLAGRRPGPGARGGVGRSLQQLRLQVGPDGRVSGERRWLVLGREDVNTPKGRNHLGESAFRDQGPLIGMINPLSCRVLLVETKDSARLSGWVQWPKGRPRLELEASQSGPGAAVFFASFQRLLTPLHNP